jgi:RND superfamily putative drug exporter
VNSLLERLGRFVSRHKWWFVAAWVVILLGLSFVRNQFGGDYVNNYTISGSQSQDGLNRLNADFPNAAGYGGQIVFHSRSGQVSDDANAVKQAMTNLSKLPHVIKATDPFAQNPPTTVSKDGTIAYGSISWNVVPASLAPSYLDRMNHAVEPARAAGLVVDYGGQAGNIGNTESDMRSEIIGLTAALILLLIMFGSLVAAGIPLVAAIFSVGSGLALVGILAAVTQFPTSAPTVATLLGLGVAVDYGLFLTARHREQIDQGMDIEASIGRTAATSGAAIVVAGGTVIIAILGLYLSGVPFVGAMGAASAIVVAVTVLSALTLVPALLAVIRGNVKSLRVRIAIHRGKADKIEVKDHEHGGFARWGKMVSNRPWPWAIASALLLVFLAIPLFSLRLGQLDAGSNPTSDSNRRAFDLITDGFGVGANGALTVVVTLPKQSQSANQQLLSKTQSKLEKTNDVKSVSSPSVSPSGNTAIISVVPDHAPQAQSTTNLVTDIRDNVLPTLGTKAYVVGTTAASVDFTNKISSRMPWLILTVVLLAMVVLTVAFRSIVISAKAAVLNLLSVGAAYGVMIAIFQWGWGSQFLGIEAHLPIPAYIPMLMFAIVFGLSMDYEVFLLSRVHEAWVATQDAHRSVAIGIGHTARVITTAAAIMIVVFTSFVTSTDPTIKMLSIGMAAAVLIDASIVRMCLVPSVMALLGKRAWYLPHWMDRIIPDLELEGGSPSAKPAGEPVTVGARHAGAPGDGVPEQRPSEETRAGVTSDGARHVEGGPGTPDGPAGDDAAAGEGRHRT